jgi:hypothetical protein
MYIDLLTSFIQSYAMFKSKSNLFSGDKTIYNIKNKTPVNADLPGLYSLQKSGLMMAEISLQLQK